jgi:hypothetical protein
LHVAPADNAAMEAEPPKADLPKRERRWYQFTLRTLLILTLIVAIPCALMGRRIERKRHERDILKTVQELGAGWNFDYERDGGQSEPPHPFACSSGRRR